jgi:hypothetical protein
MGKNGKMQTRIIRFIKKSFLSRLNYYVRLTMFSLGIGRTAQFLKQNREYFNEYKKAMYQMAAKGIDVQSYINSCKNKTVKAIRVLNIPHNEHVPIMLCAVKDDLVRIKAQLEHHRKIGITHFAYIDNMSTDGTFEWLLEQKDISLFRVEEKFHATVKNAWRKQVTDILGYDKWYLILDSDELFIYPGIEHHPINEYIQFLEQENIMSPLTFMLDMYTKDSLFSSSSISDDDFRTEFCYFDTNTYTIKKTQQRWEINGGPRRRVFSSTNNKLTKYCLIKLSKSMISFTHGNYPLKLNFNVSLPIALLLHYKFLPHDNSIFEERMQSGVYAHGSISYKRYKEIYSKNPNISFYYEDSQKLTNSLDLMKIELLDKEFFAKFLKKDK